MCRRLLLFDSLDDSFTKIRRHPEDELIVIYAIKTNIIIFVKCQFVQSPDAVIKDCLGNGLV